MFKHLIALVLVVLAVTFVSPAVAQQPPGTSVGTLTCKMAPSIGLIFGSRQRMACRFTPNGPNPPEAYVGVMGTIGLDVGITAGGVMAWGVLAPTAGPRRGALAGTYVGASGAIGVGVGVGANLLFGGTGRSIALAATFCRGVGWDQPVSWSFKSHAFLGPMRIPQNASPSLHRDPAATSAKLLGWSQSSEDVR